MADGDGGVAPYFERQVPRADTGRTQTSNTAYGGKNVEVFARRRELRLDLRASIPSISSVVPK